jgi:phosphatidylglycerophosphatase A
MKTLVILLATGFGLGWSPLASGTVGSLPGVLVAWAVASWSLGPQILTAVILAMAAVLLCEIGEQHFGRKDDGRIVADEYLTFPICLIGIPWLSHPWFLAVAFVICRLMDIVKPPPARQAQNLTGGLGIVADDVTSSLYALLVNHVLWHFIAR